MKKVGLLLALMLALVVSAAHAEEPRDPAPAPAAEAAEADLARLEAELAVLREAGDERGAAGVLGRIAAALVRLQRYDDALRQSAEAVAAYRALGDGAAVARALYPKAGLEMALQRYAEAEASYAAGLEAMADVNQPRAKVVLLLGLSRARRGRGHQTGALEAARAALEIQETLEDPCRTATARGCVGGCLFSLGRYAEALETHLLALEVFREHEDPGGIASALTNLGNVYLRIGSFDEAQASYEEALGLFRDRKDQINVAVTLGNLGIVFEVGGELDRSRERYEEALAILEATSDRRRLAGTLAPAGIVDMRLGLYDEASAKEKRAIDLYEAQGNKRGMASALVNLANIQERQGRLSDAHASCDRAEAVWGEHAPPAARAAVMWSRARVFLAAKQAEEAVGETRRAIDMISGLTQGLADTEEAATRDVYDGLFDVGIQAAVALGDAGELAWMLEQSRAVVLRDGLAQRCLLSAADVPDSLCQDVAAAQAARRDATERYRQAAAGQDLNAVRAARAELEAADDEFQRVMRRVERRSKAAADLLDTEPSDLEQLKARVSPKEALVLYGLAEDVAVALIVRREEVRTVRLDPPQRILDAVEALDASDPKKPSAGVATAAAELQALLADPLDLPASVKRVLVSPVGGLGFVPFCLLFPDRDVAYMPSGSTHGQLLSGFAPRGRGILALGDPDYRGHGEHPGDRSRGGGRMRLLRLPATRQEVERIGTVQLLGKEASEAGLAASIGKEDRWLAVHFACHGFVDRTRPMMSSLALSTDDANDGFLTCHEILQLRIPADLVVLSACETGSGRVYRTEGIVGLTRAFMFAGADRVVCSQWLADDAATQALMVRFYDLWHPGSGQEALGAAAALRQAQEYVRTHPDHPEWRHPFYWAAWVLWGLPD